MGKRYHINKKGNPGECKATVNCPLGSLETGHYDTPQAAAEAYAAGMATLPALLRRKDALEPGEVVPVWTTLHGSRLYGLAREDSDYDNYVVAMGNPRSLDYLRRKTSQQLKGADDLLRTELSEFLQKCHEGVPQALEAMFSPMGSGLLEDYRSSYFLNTATFANTYRRTILNFARMAMTDEAAKALIPAPTAEELAAKGIAKRKRSAPAMDEKMQGKYRNHAVRLTLNRTEGIEFGRFNPHLTPDRVDFVLTTAALDDRKLAAYLLEEVY